MSGATLVVAPHEVAAAVAAALPATAALARAGLVAGAGWPHADSADALRPLGEHGAPGDTGTFLVVVDGAVVGECGCTSAPDARGAVEIGYGLAPGARGRGTGTQAVTALLAWLDGQPGVRQVTAEVLPGNEASLRLLARLGFTVERSQPPYVRLVRSVA